MDGGQEVKLTAAFSERDLIDKKWKNFTDTSIDVLKEKFPGIKVEDIPGWGETPEGGGEPSTNFAIFMCSLIFAIFWITYITFFNSRVVGSFLTKLANSKILKHFIGETGGHIKVRRHIICIYINDQWKTINLYYIK